MQARQRMASMGSEGLLLAASALFAQRATAEEPRPGDGAPEQAQPAVDPAAIWPVSLQRLAGTYRFIQVSSPGGLWEYVYPRKRGVKPVTRQVSIDEAPAPLRAMLQHAEVSITDLKLPTTIDASERTSPSGRGKLRFYEEEGAGRLVVRNLPGASGTDGDKGQYSGAVVFHLLHTAHSNPSPSGIYLTRQRQEPTWGAAAIDYADLIAGPEEPRGEEPKNGGQPGAEEKVAPAKARPAAADAHAPDVPPVLSNIRVLRSGYELIAFVEWKTTDATAVRSFRGSVRLLRVGDPAEQPGVAPAAGGVSSRPASLAPVRPAGAPRPGLSGSGRAGSPSGAAGKPAPAAP